MGPASFLMPEDLIVAAPQPARPARAHRAVAAARPGPQPRVRRRRGPHRLPRHRRDDEPRLLAALPHGDVGGVAAAPLRCSPTPSTAAVVEFLYREARLADEARYAEWLALWTDDGVYWVPATTDPAADPQTRTSRTSTTTARASRRASSCCRPAIATARSPPRCMRRLISNIEVRGGGRRRAGRRARTSSWPSWRSRPSTRCTGGSGRTTHRLRRVDGDLRMSRKKVVLINAAEPLPNLSFLI